MNQCCFNILIVLYQKQAMDEKLSLSKNDIKALIDKRKPVSMVTLKRRIKELLDNTYISEGEKDCNRKRYYINDNGINYVNNIVNIKNKLDIKKNQA
ncbi:hypothetical protein [Peptoanaerobacter stomatis]